MAESNTIFSFQATLVYYFSENSFCLPLQKAKLLVHYKTEKLIAPAQHEAEHHWRSEW
jgi:hypothetical protein